jgi:hypothetical protein
MKRTVNLNKMASALIGENTKVRVRMADTGLQIRPTTRGTAVGLPKGEVLVDLREKKQAVGGTFRFTLPETFGDLKGTFQVTPVKHGWIQITSCDAPVLVPGKPQPAGGSVSEK